LKLFSFTQGSEVAISKEASAGLKFLRTCMANITVIQMEFGPDPARTQADYAVIGRPHSASLRLAATFTAWTPSRRLNNPDSSFAATGRTGLLIWTSSLTVAGSAIFKCKNRWIGGLHKDTSAEGERKIFN
jgi:hypothetical protein